MHEWCKKHSVKKKKKQKDAITHTKKNNAKENFTPISYKTVKKEVGKNSMQVSLGQGLTKWYGTAQFGAIPTLRFCRKNRKR